MEGACGGALLFFEPVAAAVPVLSLSPVRIPVTADFPAKNLLGL